jgi:AcrR family transcriptional regulator
MNDRLHLKWPGNAGDLSRRYNRRTLIRQTCLPPVGTPSSSRRKASSLPLSARERIERTAYELFSRHGVRAVGVDTIAARAGVAKMTLYKNYPSKDELALAFLRNREELWTRAWLQGEVAARGRTPEARLLAVFDAFDKWFRRQDFEACAFAKVLLENDERAHPVRQAAVRHLGNIRSFIRQLASDAGIRSPDEFAGQWQILMVGSIVAAYAGDLDAARKAKAVGQRFLRGEGACRSRSGARR